MSPCDSRRVHELGTLFEDIDGLGGIQRDRPEAEVPVDRRRQGLGRWIPGIAIVRGYDRSWLSKDIVAGLVLTAILVPVGMGYAEAADIFGPSGGVFLPGINFVGNPAEPVNWGTSGWLYTINRKHGLGIAN